MSFHIRLCCTRCSDSIDQFENFPHLNFSLRSSGEAAAGRLSQGMEKFKLDKFKLDKLDKLDMEFEGNPHSGLDDATNIARVVSR